MKFIDSIIKRVGSQYIVKKLWGYENFVINEDFCAKILHFYKGQSGNFHAHVEKFEIFVVAFGAFKFTTADPTSGELQETIVNKGDQIILRPGTGHKLEALEDSEIFEASTHHKDEDTFRVKI